MRSRAIRLRIAGLLIVLLAAGAALLPALGRSAGATLVGAMLLAAGAIESWAGMQRREVAALAIAAGGVTALAGLLLIIYPVAHFWPVVNVVVGWLLIRSVLLGITARSTRDSVRTWTILSAGMDFVLAAGLIAGLGIGTLVVLIFGPTPQLVGSFAWVLALSFILNGLLQLEIASCERDTG